MSTTGGTGTTRMGLTDTILPIGSRDVTATPVAVELRGPRVGGVADTAGVNWTTVSGLATGNANSGDHIWQTGAIGASGSKIQTATTRMTLKGGTGNLGIGTTSPLARLSIKGIGTGTGITFQATNSSDLPLFTILDSGKVGIGTTTPVEKLEVNGNIKLTGSIISEGDICIGTCP